MKDNPKELNVVIPPHVQAALDADPQMAASVKEFIAILHQARAGVLSGQYKTMDDAMEALTGSRPQKVDLNGDDIDDGSSLHHDMGLDKDEDSA